MFINNHVHGTLSACTSSHEIASDSGVYMFHLFYMKLCLYCNRAWVESSSNHSWLSVCTWQYVELDMNNQSHTTLWSIAVEVLVWYTLHRLIALFPDLCLDFISAGCEIWAEALEQGYRAWVWLRKTRTMRGCSLSGGKILSSPLAEWKVWLVRLLKYGKIVWERD